MSFSFQARHFMRISLMMAFLLLVPIIKGQTVPTPEDLQKTLDSLTEEQKIEYEKMSSEDKRTLLEILFYREIADVERERYAKEAQERMEARRVARERANQEEKKLKELETKEFLDNTNELREVWDYFNSVGRERDKSIEMWNAYLKHNPGTPFRAEIYYRMGTLFTHRINNKLGEKVSYETAEHYYQKAIDEYGEKFSILSCNARLSLCNFPSHRNDIEYRKKCYEWLKYIEQDGTAEDVWPVNRIGKYFSSKRIERTFEERTIWLDSVKENLPNSYLLQVSRDAMQFASIPDLINLSKSYPDSEIAKMANNKLWGSDKKYAPIFFEPIEEPLKQPSKVVEGEKGLAEVESTNSLKALTENSTDVSPTSSNDPKETITNKSTGKHILFYVVAVLIIISIGLLWKSHKRSCE